jgi:hypothetical protein
MTGSKVAPPLPIVRVNFVSGAGVATVAPFASLEALAAWLAYFRYELQATPVAKPIEPDGGHGAANVAAAANTI